MHVRCFHLGLARGGAGICYFCDDRPEEEKEDQQPEETGPGMNHVDESDEDAREDSCWCELVLGRGIGD